MRRIRPDVLGRAIRPALLALAVSSLVMAPTVHAADSRLGIENVRVGFTTNARANLFRIGAWTPVWVQIRGGTERFGGFLEVVAPDDDGVPTVFRQPIEVAPGEMPRVVAYARPGGRDAELMIRLRDSRGRLVVDETSGNARVSLDPILPDETVLLTMGRPQGVDLVGNLPGFSAEKNAGGEVVTVARYDDSGMIPARWYGYEGAEAVVLDTNDKDLMQSLAVRGQALVDWVSRGGHLVVAVGGNWQAVRDSVLGPILPAVPTGQEPLTTLSGLETFAGATKPILPPGSPRVTVAKLEQADARGGKVLAAVGTSPLVVRGAHGFGRVTLLAIDVDQKPFADWGDRAHFWVRAADLRQPVGGENAGPRVAVGGRRIIQAGVSDLSSQLRQALEQFPGVKLVPFGWVAFFIFLYILMIGPGDYLFLKKVVKRMELTWVTFPLIVLSVSLAAYLAAYAIKGRELRVNKIDVVDIDATAGVARGSSFLNVFSPQNRDYGVALVPQPLDRPDAPAGVGAPAPSLPPATELQLSWLGVPELGFGGMAASSRVGFPGSGYAYSPPGGSERIDGLRIPIWSTKALTARWYGPSSAGAESDLVPVGTDRLAGTVTNRLDVPIVDAVLAFGKQVYLLGTIAPGATARVETSRDRQLSGLLKDQTRTYMPDRPWVNQGERIHRANLMLAVMFHDSQGSTIERVLPSDPLAYLDLSGLLGLDRPMLVGRIDRAGSRLVLDNAPAEPRIEQTTMVRILLPLAKGEASNAAGQ